MHQSCLKICFSEKNNWEEMVTIDTHGCGGRSRARGSCLRTQSPGDQADHKNKKNVIIMIKPFLFYGASQINVFFFLK